MKKIIIFLDAIILIAFGFGVGYVIHHDTKINSDTELTTSYEDIYVCARGKYEMEIYLSGKTWRCVPMADHRSVKLYLRGK